jgi:hypothetical protein
VVFGGSFNKEEADLFFREGSALAAAGLCATPRLAFAKMIHCVRHTTQSAQYRPLFEAMSQAVQAFRPPFFFFIVHEDPSPRILSPAVARMKISINSSTLLGDCLMMFFSIKSASVSLVEFSTENQ